MAASARRSAFISLFVWIGSRLRSLAEGHGADGLQHGVGVGWVQRPGAYVAVETFELVAS
jgi:hypothetical protein